VFVICIMDGGWAQLTFFHVIGLLYSVVLDFESMVLCNSAAESTNLVSFLALLHTHREREIPLLALC